MGINLKYSNTRFDFTDATLALIPARSGSKGVERKCERCVGGISLLARSVMSAKQSTSVNRVIVSTDDQKFATLAQENGAEIPYLRPAGLATDDSSVVGVVNHLCEYLMKEESCLPSRIVLLQCTSPFVTSDDIDSASVLLEDPVEAVVSVCESEVHPDWLHRCNSEGWLCPIDMLEVPHHTPRQSMQNIYRLNGAIYWIETAVFVDKQTFLPDKTRPYVMPQSRSIDIDSEDDLRLANLLCDVAT